MEEFHLDCFVWGGCQCTPSRAVTPALVPTSSCPKREERLCPWYPALQVVQAAPPGRVRATPAKEEKAETDQLWTFKGTAVWKYPFSVRDLSVRSFSSCALTLETF